MRILDIDMDYFLDKVPFLSNDDIMERLTEEEFGKYVWSEDRVRAFFENNLGLSEDKKIKGCIVVGHNEALDFWKELMTKGELEMPFEVFHVDSHGDLGTGYHSPHFIMNKLLTYPVEERMEHSIYADGGKIRGVGIGDYLLFAIAYRWLSKLTFCINPCVDNKTDFLQLNMKDFVINYVGSAKTENVIQLVHNPDMKAPYNIDDEEERKKYSRNLIKEPEVPFITIPTIDEVQFNGDFEFAIMAQSPNYTPKSADFILDMFKKYIEF